MKKIKLLILSLLATTSLLVAQNIKPYDMLMASQNYPWGTARVMGMAGSFGAFGGDQSSLAINPAGIGVYRSSEFTITPSLNFNTTTSKFFGNSNDEFYEKFNLSNIGYIYTFNTNNDNDWVSASFGVTFNRVNDFNRNIIISRPNANSSLLDEFVYYANDGGFKPIETLTNNDPSRFYEGLAAETFLLTDELYSPDQLWASDFSFDHTYGQYQERRIKTKGGINEYDFSFGANYMHKLYLGFTFGVQTLNYDELSEHYESDNNNTVYNLKSFGFNEHYNLDGNGYNFKMGLIFRPIDMLRLGFAVHTPTFYNLNSEFYTDIYANYDSNIINNNGTLENYSAAYSDSRIIDNKLRTPWKFIGSVGLQFGNFGLINVDYERIDYTKLRLSGDGSIYTNEDVKSFYKAGNNIRIGAEGKVVDIALRAGYGFNSSAFTADDMKNKHTNTYSAGIGYRGRSFFVDFAYSYTKYSTNYTLYDWVEREETVNNNISVYPEYNPVVADLTHELNRFVLTVGFKF